MDGTLKHIKIKNILKMIIFFHQKGLTNRLKCAIIALKQEVTMQIRLNNGGKTSEFECAFKETEIIHFPDGRIEYKLSEDEVNSHFRCCANLEYQAKFPGIDAQLLEYYLIFEDNTPYLFIRNKDNNTFVKNELILTSSEMDIIKKITK